MKITRIDQYFPRHRTRLLRISTDEGVTGWGESTLEGKPRSTMSAVDEIADYLVGRDPRDIEHHWQHIYRSAFFRGGPVLMSALAGIDQALWDIAGKCLGVPVYRLLGGPTRERVRVYAHWNIADMRPETLDLARERLEHLRAAGGYTVFKGGPAGPWRAHEPPSRIDAFVKCAYTMREWVGPGVELGFDFHGKMTPALAVEICREIAGMRPMFVEEPVPQENAHALTWVTDHVTVPIATGERLLSRWEFRPLLEKQACAYLQPDVAHAGGVSELRRIAALAETYYVHLMPHCAIGAAALAACLQVDAAIPNFLVQESVGPEHLEGPVHLDWSLRDGYMELATTPGLGLEVDEVAAARVATYAEELGGVYRHPDDGSVADW